MTTVTSKSKGNPVAAKAVTVVTVTAILFTPPRRSGTLAASGLLEEEQ
jgi:hypothetical protein